MPVRGFQWDLSRAEGIQVFIFCNRKDLWVMPTAKALPNEKLRLAHCFGQRKHLFTGVIVRASVN